ncbi:MAG TPA: hypothetical protein VEH57_05305 [Thermoplasmata archaeon]|nr:hypothetical protein [Thermoplasmata archaeon]
MLHAERPRLPMELQARGARQESAREILLAVAPPPKTPSFFLSGWPSWLVPDFKSGGHKVEIELICDAGDE